MTVKDLLLLFWIGIIILLIIGRLVCVALKIKAPIINIIIYIFIIICLWVLFFCLLSNLFELANYMNFMEGDYLFKFLYKSYVFYFWYYLLYNRKFYFHMELKYPHESFVVPFYDLLKTFTPFNIPFVDIMFYVSDLFNSLEQNFLIIDLLHFEPFFLFFFKYNLFIYINLLIIICLLLLFLLIILFLYLVLQLFYKILNK